MMTETNCPPSDLSFDFIFPVWENCRVMRSTDGRWFIHETGRWGSDDSFRETSPSYAARLMEQSYPGPSGAPVDSLTASGCIG